jgi:hypothetical protein
MRAAMPACSSQIRSGVSSCSAASRTDRERSSSCHVPCRSRASASRGSPERSTAARARSFCPSTRAVTASTSSARDAKCPYRVNRPSPAACAISAIVAVGRPARQAVAASRIRSTFRTASARRGPADGSLRPTGTRLVVQETC